MKRIYLTCVIPFLLCAGGPLLAHDMEPPANEEQNIDAYVTLLRQDVQSQVVAIIGQMMSSLPSRHRCSGPCMPNMPRR